MPLDSHYDVLEVSPKASAEVIRAAYKSLMQRHHPDKSVNGTESTGHAASIALAYEVLSDPQRRRAYDQTLLIRQPARTAAAHHARASQASNAVPRTGPNAVRRLSAWYAPVLILSILLAGGSILVLSKKKAADGTPAQERAQSTPRPTESPRNGTDSDPASNKAGTEFAHETAVSWADEGQIRTISAFVTDLSIELNPDPTQSATVHVLRIPSFSLRLAISEPDRWTRRILAQRSAIIEQLVITLAATHYLELIKPDGDLYLKRLIEDTVVVVTGLDRSSALPMAGQPNKNLRAVEVLLPVSFSVQ